MTWTRRPLGFWLTLCVLLVPAVSMAQPMPDSQTTLLLGFDGTLRPEYALGSPGVVCRPTAVFAKGQFGEGIDLAEGRAVSIPAEDGNFPGPQGTIELWLMPRWAGADRESRVILNCSIGKQGYLKVNSLGEGRLGVAVSGYDKKGQQVWRRSDGDARAWQPDTWHHLAVSWGQGRVQIFLDGKPGRREVTDALMPGATAEAIVLPSSDTVVDALRVSKRVFSADDAARSMRQAFEPPYRFLAPMPKSLPEGVWRDGRTLLGGIAVPMLLGDRRVTSGLVFRSGKSLEIPLSEPFDRLVAQVGVDPLGPAEARCAFQVFGDGKKLFESHAVGPADAPVPVDVALAGVAKLTLATAVSSDGRAAFGLFANPMLVRRGGVLDGLEGGKLNAAKIDVFRRQVAADRFSFALRAGTDRLVARKFADDDLDPAVAPAPDRLRGPLEALAAPGQYEPLNFVVYAGKDFENVTVEVSPLTGEKGVIAPAAVDVRLVLRGLMRDLYTLPPERSTLVSRFLLHDRPVDIPAGTLREYQLIVHVPEEAAPGRYTGRVKVGAAGGTVAELPLEVQVATIRLRPLKGRFYGMYHRMSLDPAVRKQVDIELADMRAHEVSTVYAHFRVEFQRSGDGVKPDLTALEEGLKLLARHGFSGPLPVESGAPAAARALEFDVLSDWSDEPARRRWFAAVKAGLEGLVALGNRYPQFELLPTHMDEVFTRDRIDRYLHYTEAVRQVPSLRVYITMHNRPLAQVEEMFRRANPFVDVRCYNGHTMDTWIQAGHSFGELADELKRSGDEAWTYYNIRGSFFQPKWVRMINGFYLWISPLKANMPWTYYATSGNPLDDTDGPTTRGHDFVYAVPDPEDPSRLVSTRHWEAFREGADDMRYLLTLEELIAEQPAAPEAVAARAWLDRLRTELTPDPKRLQAIDKESPILVDWSGWLDGKRFRQFRREAAEHIAALEKLAARPK